MGFPSAVKPIGVFDLTAPLVPEVVPEVLPEVLLSSSFAASDGFFLPPP